MSERETDTANRQIYYRLITVWALCEAMLGGIIHGFKIPVSGLIIGSCAVVCISLIAWYVPARGAILKATIIVGVCKMMLSPQAPPPAYIAVFFQGLLGELLFRERKFFRVSCMLLAVFALLESGLQRILVLTLVYGNDLWITINSFINGLTKQKINTNYSLFIGVAYVVIHFITGLFVGWQASLLPSHITRWSKNRNWIIDTEKLTVKTPGIVSRKGKRFKKGLLITWILLLLLYIQSYFKIGDPLLPPHISLKIFLRSLLIVLGWVFIVSPIITQLLHGWLKKKQLRSQREVGEVLNLLPSVQQLVIQSWKRSRELKGLKRVSAFVKTVLVNIVSPFSRQEEHTRPVYLLTGPVHSGKTSSLISRVSERNDVYGIISPVVNGKRVFMNASTGEQFAMEAADCETEVLSVGRYKFSKKNFEKAIAVIQQNIDKKGWLVIDEIGPLELRGEGFADVLHTILSRGKEKILIVVRESLVDDVKDHFSIQHFIVMDMINVPEELERLN